MLGLSRKLTVRMGPSVSPSGGGGYSDGPLASRAVVAAVHAHMPGSAQQWPEGSSTREGSGDQRSRSPRSFPEVVVSATSPVASGVRDMPRAVMIGSDSWRTRGVTSPRMSDRPGHLAAHMSAEEAMLPPTQRAYVAAASSGLLRPAPAGSRARSVGRFRETVTGFHPDTHVQFEEAYNPPVKVVVESPRRNGAGARQLSSPRASPSSRTPSPPSQQPSTGRVIPFRFATQKQLVDSAAATGAAQATFSASLDSVSQELSKSARQRDAASARSRRQEGEHAPVATATVCR
jgi:hypothetical protein